MTLWSSSGTGMRRRLKRKREKLLHQTIRGILAKKSFDIRNVDRALTIVGAACRATKCVHFACFGTLLGFIRDRGILKEDGDVDIGIFYENMNEKLLTNCFGKWGYTLKKVVRNDYEVPHTPFFLHYDHAELPEIDIFAWILHKGIRYHTYDVNFENREILSKYRFKGIPDKWLNKFMDFRIDGMQRTCKIPANYGHCLDTWYPNWLERRKEVSQSEWEIVTKSCKGIGK